MLPSVAIAVFNHVLNGEPWVYKRLQSYAGKSIHLSIFPLIDLSFMIQIDGKIAIHYPVGTTPDTRLIITPSQLPRLILQDESAFHEIKIMGDTLLANEFLFIIKNLHWDIEQDLSSVFGDVPSHRIVQTGQNFICWQAGSMLNLSQATIEYLNQEKSVLSSHAYLDSFAAEINSLQDHVTSLEKRIDRLISLLPSKAEKNISLRTGSK